MSAGKTSQEKLLARRMSPFVDELQKVIDKFFIGRKKADLLEAQDLYQSILDQIHAYFETSATALVLIDDDLDFERIFCTGYAEDFDWRNEVSSGQGALSRCIARAAIDVLPDVKGDPQYIELCAATRSQISIPLTDSAGKVFGAIALEFDFLLTGDAIGEAFARTINPLSRIIAYVDSTLAMLQMQSIAGMISHLPVGQGGLTEMVEAVFDAIETITADGELAMLLRVGGSLVVTNTRHLEKSETPARLQIGAARGQGYTAWSAHTGLPHYCKDTRDRIAYPLYRSVNDQTRSQYTIPLVIRHEVIGVLNIGAKVAFAFSVDQRRLLDAIGRHATYAMFYWRLYRDTALISHEAYGRLKSLDYLSDFLLRDVAPEKREVGAALLKSVGEARGLVEAASYPFLRAGDDELAIAPSVRKILQQRQDPRVRHTLHSPSPLLLAHSIQENHLKDFLDIILNWVIARMHVDDQVLTTELLEENYEGIQYIVFRWTFLVEKALLEGLSAENLDDLVSLRAGGPMSQRLEPAHIPLWRADKILANYGGYLDIDAGRDGTDEIIIRGTIRR